MVTRAIADAAPAPAPPECAECASIRAQLFTRQFPSPSLAESSCWHCNVPLCAKCAVGNPPHCRECARVFRCLPLPGVPELP